MKEPGSRLLEAWPPACPPIFHLLPREQRVWPWQAPWAPGGTWSPGSLSGPRPGSLHSQQRGTSPGPRPYPPPHPPTPTHTRVRAQRGARWAPHKGVPPPDSLRQELLCSSAKTRGTWPPGSRGCLAAGKGMSAEGGRGRHAPRRKRQGRRIASDAVSPLGVTCGGPPQAGQGGCGLHPPARDKTGGHGTQEWTGHIVQDTGAQRGRAGPRRAVGPGRPHRLRLGPSWPPSSRRPGASPGAGAGAAKRKDPGL